MILLDNISFSFKNELVLDNVSLGIASKSIHSLVGTTGAGKTLLLKLIAGLMPLQSGKITKNGGNLSFVFQQNALFPWMTIRENMEIATGKNAEEVLLYLQKFNLESYLNYYPKQLSGGTLQKINLCRAFMNQGDFILLDEPFSHLDLIQKEELYFFMLELWKQYSPTIILVTHDIDEALFLSHEVSYLSKKSKNIVYTSVVTSLNTPHEKSINDLRSSSHGQKFFHEFYTLLKSESL